MNTDNISAKLFDLAYNFFTTWSSVKTVGIVITIIMVIFTHIANKPREIAINGFVQKYVYGLPVKWQKPFISLSNATNECASNPESLEAIANFKYSTLSLLDTVTQSYKELVDLP